jgi:hypothetical protein
MANWALVIGCDTYWDPSVGLRGAVRDALAVRTWLLARDKGKVPRQNLTFLATTLAGAGLTDGVTSKEATRDNIVLAIDDLLNRSADDEGSLFFFFAGHGLTGHLDFGDEPAIVPADFTPRLTTKAIPIRSILQQFVASTLQTQFFFIDACRNVPFEGEFRITGLDRPKRADFTRPDPDQYACFATSPGLKAHELGVAGDERGAFTTAMLRGLEGEGRAKLWDPESAQYLVRFEELFRFIEADVASRKLGDEHLFQRPKRQVTGGGKNPVLMMFADGAFLDEPLDINIDPPDCADHTSLEIADAYDSRPNNPPLATPLQVQLAPRTYSVRARAEGFAPMRRAWVVELYEPSSVHVQLEPARDIPSSGPRTRSLRGPRGAARPGRLVVEAADPMAIVEAVNEAGEIRSALTRLELDQAGHYRVRLRTPEGIGPEEVVEVLPGADDTVVVKPPALKSSLVADLATIASAGGGADSGIGLPSMLRWAVTRPSALLALAFGAAIANPPWADRVQPLGVETVAIGLRNTSGVLVAVAMDEGEVPDLTARIGDQTVEMRRLRPGVSMAALRQQPGPVLLSLEGLGIARLLTPIYIERDRPAIVIIEVDADGRPGVYQHGLPVGDDVPVLDPDALRAADFAERFGRQGRLREALMLLDGAYLGLPSLALRGYLLFAIGGDSENLREVVETLISRAPTLPDGHVLGAMAIARDGDVATARDLAGNAVASSYPLVDAGLLAAADLAGTTALNLMLHGWTRVPEQVFTTFAERQG